jgi:TRAP-type C4-dicarboxylate transport system substrate-binding protein
VLLADPPGTSLDVGAHHLQTEVARKSHGRLLLDVRANGEWQNQPRSELTLLRAVHDGEAEMAIISTAPLTNYAPDFQILDMPFLFTSAHDIDTLVDGPSGHELLDTLPPLGFQGLAFWDSGFRVIASAKPWHKMQDMQSQRIRVMESDVYQVFMHLLGARPVPVGSNKVYDMVSSGYLDAVDMAYAALLQHRICDVFHYILETRHIDEQKVVLVNDQVFRHLTPQEQNWLTSAVWASRTDERRLFRAEEARAIDTMRAQGVTLTEVSPTERARMKAACQPMYQSLAQKLTRPWEQALLQPH